MSQNGPTILCVNHWHDDNKGDSAITEGTVRLLSHRWPRSRIRIASLQSAAGASNTSSFRNIQRLFPDVACEAAFTPTETGTMPFGDRDGRDLGGAVALLNSVAWLLRLLPFIAGALIGRPAPAVTRRLRDVDLVVLLGGSNIYDNPNVHQAFSLARLFTVLYPAWAAQQLGIPVVAFGHTLGPFDRRAGAWLARRTLRRTTSILLREEESLAITRRLDLRPVHVGPDVAFAVEPQRTPAVASLLERLPSPPSRSLALVVRQHPHDGRRSDERVLAELARFATSMLASDRVEHVLVIVQAFGPTPIEDDRSISAELARLLPEGRASLVAEDFTAGELAALYGACRLVVTVRLHAAILAIAGGAPAYAIAYFTAKTAGVMRAAELPQAWTAHDQLTSAGITAQLDHLLDPLTRDRLAARVAGWRVALRDEVAAWTAERRPVVGVTEAAAAPRLTARWPRSRRR